MKCSGENVILRGIFHVVSRFLLLFMLYRGNLDCLSNSVDDLLLLYADACIHRDLTLFENCIHWDFTLFEKLHPLGFDSIQKIASTGILLYLEKLHPLGFNSIWKIASTGILLSLKNASTGIWFYSENCIQWDFTLFGKLHPLGFYSTVFWKLHPLGFDSILKIASIGIWFYLKNASTGILLYLENCIHRDLISFGKLHLFCMGLILRCRKHPFRLDSTRQKTSSQIGFYAAENILSDWILRGRKHPLRLGSTWQKTSF